MKHKKKRSQDHDVTEGCLKNKNPQIKGRKNCPTAKEIIANQTRF